MHTKLNLTKTQTEQLQELATRNGMRLLITRNQVGIGPSGCVWFAVVYTTYGHRTKWDIRDKRQHTEIRKEMASIIG